MSNTLNAVLQQYENSQKKDFKPKMTDEERKKRYLSTAIEDGKSTGQLKIRILPNPNGGSPFQEVYYHSIQVDNKWRKLYDPERNEGKPSPLNDVARALRATGGDREKELAKKYQSRKFYICRVIDRNNEADGVKFWRFGHNWKQGGVFDKLAPIFNAKGDITDIENGYDLIVSLGRDDKGYAKVNSIFPDDRSPLSADPEQAQAWVNDPMTSDDVYSKPEFGALEIIAKYGESPYFDKETKTYIRKSEWEAKRAGVQVERANNAQATANNQDDQADVFLGGNDDLPF